TDELINRDAISHLLDVYRRDVFKWSAKYSLGNAETLRLISASPKEVDSHTVDIVFVSLD
ncbi:hypothetical protein ACSYAD_36445, partial [Acaryochloris marina NIES-2412]|uniref:hypothetical protein n=1 Tax=Acaryochloris marina TaxID=155978 RepID=UPI0040593A78